MSELTELLTIVGLFTAVHFVARSLRNWRDILRLIPIGSVTPLMVRQYKTIPLRFVGSDTMLANTVTYLYGRLWIRPGAKKQAALCNWIVFLNRDRTARNMDRSVEAGSIIRITLSEGENSRHIRRAARRCTRGPELTLAMLFPTQDRAQFKTPVRCVTVRARARSVRDDPDRLPTRVIEWEAIDPAGIGASVDSALEGRDVPSNAFWLISKEEPSEDDPYRLRSGGVFFSYGSSRPRGFLSFVAMVCFKLLIGLLVVMATGVVLSVTNSFFILLLSTVVPMVLLYRLVYYMVEQELPERFRAQAPTVRQRVSVFGLWTTTVYRELEWHGSTRRSLAWGNRIRRVGFWQQFHFVYWEPFVDWMRRRMR